jgi:hypothetical protein
MLKEAIQEAMSLELINKSNGTKSRNAHLADMDDKDLAATWKTWTTLQSKGSSPKAPNPEDSPSGKPFSLPAPKVKEAKAEMGQTNQPPSVASARRRDTCRKSATPGSTRTPPVSTGTASHQSTMNKMQN